MNEKIDRWEVLLAPKAGKAQRLLPEKIRNLASTLIKELAASGPIRKDWKNFGPISEYSYHCHIKKGRPTYVACWREVDKQKRIIEVFYVGIHENAPY